MENTNLVSVLMIICPNLASDRSNRTDEFRELSSVIDILLPFFITELSSRNSSVLLDLSLAKFGQIIIRTDTRLVFSIKKLMRTDIVFTRTTKDIWYFLKPLLSSLHMNLLQENP
jgi:hypothetical protein